MDAGSFFHLESTIHEGLMRKRGKKFRKIGFLTDLNIVCTDGEVSLHKILLLRKLPQFSRYLCDICDHHSETYLILPDVTKSDLENEVKKLYSEGIVTAGLKVFLGFKSTNLDEKKKVNVSFNQVHSNESLKNDTENHSDEEFEFVNPRVVSNSNEIVLKQEVEEESDVKLDIKVVDELKSHSFEFIQSARANNISPGILIVDNKFKYFYQSVESGRYSYNCASRGSIKCPSRALVRRDDSGKLVVVRCALDDRDAHNHEASEVDVIAWKMKKDMLETMKMDPSQTVYECLAAAKAKFSLETEAQLWEEVMTYWGNPVKIKNLHQNLNNAKKSALGFSDSLLGHVKYLDTDTGVLVDESTTNTGDNSHLKLEMIDQDELQHHSFEFLQSQRSNSSTSPGILIVDEQFKYFFQSVEAGRYSYNCASRKSKCPARALVRRDDTGQAVVVRCAAEGAHNHEASKAYIIVRKMQSDMVEMIKADPYLTAEECLAAAKTKYSMKTSPGQLWEEVLTHWENPKKFQSLQTILKRAKNSTLGFTESLMKHLREVDDSGSGFGL